MMEKIKNFISNLQGKPDYIKQRIFVATSVVAAMAVVGIWFTGFKNQVQSISGSDILDVQNLTQESAPHYMKIENSQQKDGKTLIYFSVTNDTADILNLPQASDISAVINGQSYKATMLTDRQNNQFSKKALSNSTNYGIATFDGVLSDSGEMVFANLHFEQSPETIFKETVPVDFSKLTPPQEIRS